MYSKRKEVACTSTDDQLNEYSRTLKKIDRELPNDLAVEFDKVLVDLLRVKSEKGSIFRRFKFADVGFPHSSFNYEKLENYLLNEVKTYDQSI